jgi:hypothetical protein
MDAGSARGFGRFPAVRQEVEDATSWVRVDAREHVREVVDRVDAVLLAGRDERVEDGEVVSLFFASDKEEVLTVMRTHA